MGAIKNNVSRLLASVPSHVTLVAACKTRNTSEIREAIASGIDHLGQNYIAEAESAFSEISEGPVWHLIGHLQTNKVRRAVAMFHLIETLDSFRLANKLNTEAEKAGRIIECLVEVNSASESNKTGILPEDLNDFILSLSEMRSIKIIGLMTMGPVSEDQEKIRPYFRLARTLFEELRSKNLPENISMKHLSMGMSDSYLTAIEEGSTMVRIGTAIFGARE